jgi:hypothetical protein
MGLELAYHYEDVKRKEHPYTHLLQTKIPSLGMRRYDGHDYRIPDLLLTIQFRLDAKGNVMHEPKLTFQPDGPSDAQLNFRHHTLRFEHSFSVCRFWVSMDALYGEGVVMKESTTIGGTVGAEKIVKGEVQAGAEFGKEAPGTRTTLHGQLEGLLTTKMNLVEVWGHLV